MIPLSPKILQLAKEYDPELWKKARSDIPVHLLVPHGGGIEFVTKLNPEVREFMFNFYEMFQQFADNVKKVLEE